MSSTGRGAIRHPDDYYATPAWCTRAILTRLDVRGKVVLEPACGSGAIIRELVAAGASVFGVELDAERAQASCAARAIEVYCDDFLAPRSALMPRPDVIITNPPFSLAMEFVQRSLDVVREGGTVCMLLRLAWLASDGRSEWLRANTPSVNVLSTRPSFCLSVKCKFVGAKPPAIPCTYRATLPTSDPRPKACPLCGRSVTVSTTDSADYGWMTWRRDRPGWKTVPTVRILECEDRATGKAVA